MDFKLHMVGGNIEHYVRGKIRRYGINWQKNREFKILPTVKTIL